MRKVGDAHGVAVLDLWNAFMVEAGWKIGESLPGALDGAESAALKRLLVDGLNYLWSSSKILMLC